MTFSAWPCSRASLHRRRHANAPCRRSHRAAPSTPLLRWKLDDAASSPASKSPGGALLSSRKLAADLWQLRFNEITVADGRDSLSAGPCDSLPTELKPSFTYLNCAMEKKTKGDRERSKESDDVRHVFKHQKLPAEKRGPSVSVVSTLQEELLQARCRIRELQASKQSLRKKVKILLNKLEDERISRQRKERLKNYSATDELKDELVRGRKSRRRMEILNAKFANQLANVKLSAERLMQGYEEEKKSRELMEGVCDKLVKQIGENKGEIERLKEEYVKVREELEEERKMLQLAEVWREERVQMKLVDAKLALEDKYSKMNMLITDLETLLGSASFPLDAVKLRKAENILQAAAGSLSSQDIFEKFSYVPPESDDLFSIRIN